MEIEKFMMKVLLNVFVFPKMMSGFSFFYDFYLRACLSSAPLAASFLDLSKASSLLRLSSSDLEALSWISIRQDSSLELSCSWTYEKKSTYGKIGFLNQYSHGHSNRDRTFKSGQSISLSFLNPSCWNLVSRHILARCLDTQNLSSLSLVLS